MVTALRSLAHQIATPNLETTELQNIAGWLMSYVRILISHDCDFLRQMLLKLSSQNLALSRPFLCRNANLDGRNTAEFTFKLGVGY